MPKLMNGGQALVQALLTMGSSRIYGIIGTSNVAFVDALFDVRGEIRYVSCRHEQVGASMADVEGRLTGKPGVALVHSGPGALNTMIAVGNAYKDCSPLILITGAVKRRLAQSDGMLEVDHRRLFAPLCKGTFRIESASEVLTVFSQAYRAAMSGARGPVIIEVPEDVWTEVAEIDIETMELVVDALLPVSQAHVRDALDIIYSAKLPLVLSGGGVAYSRSSGDLAKFVQALSLPVITTGNGRGTIPETHPLSLGRVGFGGGNLVADKALEICDTLLCLGAGISDMTTYEFTTSLEAKNIMVVNISPDCLPPQAPKNKLVVCDVADFLHQLVKEVDDSREPVRSSWHDALTEVRAMWDGMCQASLNPKGSLPPAARVIKELAEKLPDDTIVSVGAGIHLLYPMVFMPCNQPQTFMSTVNFGAMGFGMAASMAASMVHSERTVIAILGDGDFMMTVQDLETVVREGLNIKVFIINDCQYRVLNVRQKLQFGGRILGTEHSNPDFAELAKCFGASGYRLDSPERIDTVLDAVISEKGPVVVDVIIDPEDLPPLNIEATFRMSAS